MFSCSFAILRCRRHEHGDTGCRCLPSFHSTILGSYLTIVTEQSRSSSTSKRNDSGSSESSCLSPSHVCFTPSGAISVIVDVKSETLAIRLTALERNLARVTKGVGSDSQAKYVSPPSASD